MVFPETPVSCLPGNRRAVSPPAPAPLLRYPDRVALSARPAPLVRSAVGGPEGGMTREQLMRMSDGFFEGGLEADEDYLAWVDEYRALTAQEYADLKELIWSRASRGGGFLTLYIFLVVSGPAPLCTLCGCAGGLLYLSWLFRDGEWIWFWLEWIAVRGSRGSGPGRRAPCRSSGRGAG